MEKLYQKRIIWIGFVVVFILLIPVLFSQALGYKYNWDKNQFEATGILFIKTYPKDTQIILNDELQIDKTPWQKPKLLPGRYNLKVNKTDYLPWEKNLNIYEHQTTFVEDIVLYKRSLPVPINKIELSNWLTNNNSIYIFQGIANNMQVILKYNANNDQWNTIKEYDRDYEIELVSLSPQNTKLIYKVNGIYKLTLVDNSAIEENLTGLSQIYWQDIVWDTLSDNIIYSQTNNQLHEIIISTMPVIITNSILNVIDQFAHAGSIYYLQASEDNSQIILNRASRNFNNQEALLLLPYTSNVKYIPSNGLLTLLDEINNFLYLIDLNNDKIIAKVFPNVTAAEWYNTNYDKILYWNAYELSVYYVNRQESQLVTRVSEPITNAWWHPNGTYTFYKQNNIIHIVELDARDKKNNYELVTLNNATPFIINTKGDKIIYYSAEDKTIYKQAIQ